MHEYHLLQILAMGFGIALICGYITQRLGLSPIVGYLIAGFIISPSSPGFVGDMGLAGELAEVGVILMMFGVGLHFDLKDLLAVKGVAIPGALMQTTVSALFGLLIALHFNLTVVQGLILGFGIAVASTVVLLRVLTDNNALDTVHGHVAVGWLVVEDIFTVLILVLLPTIASIMDGAKAASIANISFSIGKAMVNLVLLWVAVLVVGGKVVPWVMKLVARTRSQELFTLTALAAAFATAMGAAVLFNASMALGAFLGGMVVGKSSLHHQAGANIIPLKDAFSVLFFVSVGMLFNPNFLIENYALVLACLLIVLLVKPLVAAFAVLVLGYSVTTALTVAIALSQVGEFSFILAQQAKNYNIIENNVYSVLVICALISITLNPVLFKKLPQIESFLRKRRELWNFLNTRADRKARKGNLEQHDMLDLEAEHATLAIVVGHGPTGRNVTEVLQKKGVVPVMIDLNVDTINQLNKEGIHAIYGDSSNPTILKAAGIEKARYLVLTVSAVSVAAATATMARSINPNLRIFARVRFIQDADLLSHVGADFVAVEEQEIAIKLAEILLEDLNKYEGMDKDLIHAL